MWTAPVLRSMLSSVLAKWSGAVICPACEPAMRDVEFQRFVIMAAHLWAVESTWSSCLPLGKTVISWRYSASQGAFCGHTTTDKCGAHQLIGASPRDDGDHYFGSHQTPRWRGVGSNLEFLDAFARSASSSDLLERAFWR